ncbi:hypothetical protein QCA50_019884 [Cerrena zonata]|uniref:non-specific serine/threonine protein kinase n=1 Tax=Cerrena zonata TaxID=2478898 RepID=A0AAW0F8H1_9APHY
MSGKPKFPLVAGFKLTELLGGGSFASVYRAVNFEEEQVGACKVVNLTPKTTDEERRTLRKEMKSHSRMRHPNVIEFYNAVIVEPGSSSSYHPAVYMLLEMAAGGDLFDKIAPEMGVGEEIAQFYFTQMISGISYIHTQGVCHRDLKPENILLDAAGTLKICDFGLCSIFKDVKSGKTRQLTERCGSLPYLAPELVGDEPYDAEPIDVWGCGIILFAILTGTTPWDEPTKRSPDFYHYLRGKCFDENPWNEFSSDCLSILTGLLAVDSAERLTCAQAFRHAWMLRPSQLANQGPAAIANKLTENLRKQGDYDYIDPSEVESDVDEDGDTIMKSMSPHQSQFTQSLLLFSQTQYGKQYTPQLTRFYASVGPGILLPLIEEALTNLGVKYKPAEHVKDKNNPNRGLVQIRIGGYDQRKLMYKGYVKLENFTYKQYSGTFCLMHRDQGNPISWRQLWKALVKSSGIEPLVLRKEKRR